MLGRPCKHMCIHRILRPLIAFLLVIKAILNVESFRCSGNAFVTFQSQQLKLREQPCHSLAQKLKRVTQNPHESCTGKCLGRLYYRRWPFFAGDAKAKENTQTSSPTTAITTPTISSSPRINGMPENRTEFSSGEQIIFEDPPPMKLNESMALNGDKITLKFLDHDTKIEVNGASKETNVSINELHNSTDIESNATSRKVKKEPSYNFFESFESFYQPQWNYTIKNLEQLEQSLALSLKEATTKPASKKNIIKQTMKKESISLSDLEAYLQANGYIRQSDVSTESSNLFGAQQHNVRRNIYYNNVNGSSILGNLGTSQINKKFKKMNNTSSASNVAFPQPSVLSYKTLKRSTMAASAATGIVLGYTIFPNLWLIGGIISTLYAYEITKNIPETIPTNFVANFLIRFGRNLAKKYLTVYDYIVGFWFMYKTGQLSYEYYKQYAAIDEKFGIQSKIDAWNARFQEGKVAFDEWEKENEVGRKVLATLRTVWLVEEQAMKKKRPNKKSKYRMVQYLYNVKYWLQVRIRKVYKKLSKITWEDSNSSLREFFAGVKLDTIGDRSVDWGTRLGSVGAALVFVYITGALFAISPLSLTILSVALGVIWPTWFAEVIQRFWFFLEETKERGRDKKSSSTNDDRKFAGGGVSKPKPNIFTVPIKNTFNKERVDKSRYHFYRRQDGSKRYYRAGRSIFWTTKPSTDKKKKEEFNLPFPFNLGYEKQEDPKSDWLLFGRKPKDTKQSNPWYVWGS